MEQMNPGQVKKYLKQLKQRQEQYLYYMGQLAYKAGEQGKLEDPELLEGLPHPEGYSGPGSPVGDLAGANEGGEGSGAEAEMPILRDIRCPRERPSVRVAEPLLPCSPWRLHLRQRRRRPRHQLRLLPSSNPRCLKRVYPAQVAGPSWTRTRFFVAAAVRGQVGNWPSRKRPPLHLHSRHPRKL